MTMCIDRFTLVPFFCAPSTFRSVAFWEQHRFAWANPPFRSQSLLQVLVCALDEPDVYASLIVAISCIFVFSQAGSVFSNSVMIMHALSGRHLIINVVFDSLRFDFTFPVMNLETIVFFNEQEGQADLQAWAQPIICLCALSHIGTLQEFYMSPSETDQGLWVSSQALFMADAEQAVSFGSCSNRRAESFCMQPGFPCMTCFDSKTNKAFQSFSFFLKLQSLSNQPLKTRLWFELTGSLFSSSDFWH